MGKYLFINNIFRILHYVIHLYRMSTTKKALLIGCNYTNDPNNRLYGCISDVTNVANTLIDAFDYDLRNVVVLRDDSPASNLIPTKRNILAYLNQLVQNSANLTEIWIHYSGHGSTVIDRNNDESDNLDEVIVPTDFRTAGFITDDEIFDVLKRMSRNCRIILGFDSCHSGTICDLQYGVQTNGTRSIVSRKVLSNPNIYCFSGCRDSQLSEEIYNTIEARNSGAFTTVFLYCLRLNHFNVDAIKLYSDICNIFRTSGFEQIPQFSSSNNTVNLVFGRSTYRDKATLQNPTPTLLAVPVTTGDVPIVKRAAKMWLNFI